MIELHTWGTPNGHKISIALEELGLAYTVVPVNLAEGAQRTAAHLALNPNGKIPAIAHRRDDGGVVTVFESGAILVYLADFTGRLLGRDGQERADALAWTFWQVGGLGPMLGQWMYFTRSAPAPQPEAIARYRDETLRLLQVLDRRLDGREHLAGRLSIADIANFGWADAALRLFVPTLGEGAPPLTHARRWLAQLSARPGFLRGRQVPG